jgi:hypothetical protein
MLNIMNKVSGEVLGLTSLKVSGEVPGFSYNDNVHCQRRGLWLDTNIMQTLNIIGNSFF